MKKNSAGKIEDEARLEETSVDIITEKLDETTIANVVDTDKKVNDDSKRIHFSIVEGSQYDAVIPVSKEGGLMINIGEYEPLGKAIFVGYRRRQDKSMGDAEKNKIFRNFGDVIMAINGVDVSDKSFPEVVQCLKDVAKDATVTLRMAETSMKKQTGDLFILPEDIFIRKIFLSHLPHSQRIELFGVQKLCRHFHLENHVCKKHGCVYDWEEDEEGDGTETMGTILAEMIRDGKDPSVFHTKLAQRTEEFPVKRWEDEAFNLPETSLLEDDVFGEYFRRLKKCEECECEAETRKDAKRGVMDCPHCLEEFHIDEGVQCETCEEILGCEDCPWENGANHCEFCETTFCSECRQCFMCDWCLRSACEECDVNVKSCAICANRCCDACGNDEMFYCQLCEQWFCDDCKSGGILDCGCQVETCCRHCRPSDFCEVCMNRWCLECSKAKGDCESCNCFYCDSCGGASPCQACGTQYCRECEYVVDCKDCGKHFCEACQPHDDLRKCRGCKDVYCSGCRDRQECDDCESRFCEKCMLTCKHCLQTSCKTCVSQSKGKIKFLQCTSCELQYHPVCAKKAAGGACKCGGTLEDIKLEEKQAAL